jgi:hypothetical protein
MAQSQSHEGAQLSLVWKIFLVVAFFLRFYLNHVYEVIEDSARLALQNDTVKLHYISRQDVRPRTTGPLGDPKAIRNHSIHL